MPGVALHPATRRRATFLTLLAAWVFCFGACTSREEERPNVLLLVMDTTRADRCSFLGYERPTTPRLEALAKDSMVFSDAWSPSSWTFPAHVALFTGCTPESLGIVAEWPQVLPPGKALSLAELLVREGWAAGCFTNNPWIAPHSGLSRGFDPVDQVFLNRGGASARQAHDRALSWMKSRQKAGQRFFAFINDVEPHAPHAPPKEFGAKFVSPTASMEDMAEGCELDFPDTLVPWARGTEIRPGLRRVLSDLYDAEVAHLDDEIGRLVDGMREAGLLEKTMLVIVGDHGEGLTDHGWMEHGTFLHRELLRVPLLVRPPGGCPPRVVKDLVRIQDVFPTILEACSVAVPAEIDGRTLTGETTGRTLVGAERTRLDVADAVERAVSREAAAPLRIGRRTLYDGKHHLLVADDGKVELYAPAEDPGETRDLSGSLPDVLARMRRTLDATKPK